ncbi:uncharacterized protein LOC123553063 [Mercenaria mercenaria]|uniref:uncharacterized protein LOC123553063 n=1 Tax=Mercenaria mercenaria TaxID=6596 RepID=UPI00234F3A8F|nr:uncharacterized protein LOC123553063 [Mercenaria mercenaria]
MRRSLFISVALGFCFVFAKNGSIILSPETENKGPPICTSSSSLCGLNYRYVTDDDIPVEILYSENEICQCPDNRTCAIRYDWDHMTNSVVQRLLTGGGHQLLVKISYCQLPKKRRRPCGFNKPVLVSRGRGMFKFDLVGEMLCICKNRPLVPRSGWIEGEYDYVEYGCGQPKCSALKTKVCSDVTLVGEELRSRYFCRCKKFEICNGELPYENGQTLQHTCQLM